MRGSKPFNVFINGKIAGSSNHFKLSLDSLSRIFASTALLVAVHEPEIRKGGFTTVIQTPVVERQPYTITKRESSAFRDFVIIGIMALLVMIITIVRLNPKLASDYLSVIKIFSMREGDDSQIYSRIASSTNILFYVFCSLMLGYYLMVIFHFVPSRYTAALSFQSETFGGLMLQWLELSMILLIVFFIKIVLIFGLSSLFGMRGIAGIHLFNWVRLLLVIFGLLTAVVFIYCISHGQNENFLSTLLLFLAWTLGGWMILIFLKLGGRMSHSMFHLFSYICATELIPFLITIKVLYN
jgi:hypothetical protein